MPQNLTLFLTFIAAAVVITIFVVLWRLYWKHIIFHWKASPKKIKEHYFHTWRRGVFGAMLLVVGSIQVLLGLYDKFFEDVKKFPDFFWVGIFILVVGLGLVLRRKNLAQSVQKEKPKTFAGAMRIAFILVFLFYAFLNFWKNPSILEIIIASLIFVMISLTVDKILKKRYET